MEKPLKAMSAIIFTYSFVTSIVTLASGLRVYELTGSSFYLSLTSFSYNLFYALSSYFYSHIASKVKQLHLVSIALGLMSASVFSMFLFPSAFFIIAFNALYGSCVALISPTLITMFTEYVMRDYLGITRTNILTSLGNMFGLLAAAFLGGVLSPGHLLLLNSFILGSSISLVKYLPERAKVVSREKISITPLIYHVIGSIRAFPSMIVKHEKLISFKELYYEFRKMLTFRQLRSVPVILLATSVLFTAISIFFTPMPAYLKMFGYSDRDIYTFSLIANITTLLLYDFFRARTSYEKNVWRTLIISIIVRPFLFLLPLLTFLLPKTVVFAVLYTFIGMSWAGISTALPLIVMNYSDPRAKGGALSKMNAMMSIGSILGSFIGGVVSQIWGIIGTSILASLLVSVAAYMYLKSMRALIT